MNRVQAQHDAVTAGDPDALTRLFADGGDPAASFDDLPVVLEAAGTGRVELVRPFLDAGLPVDPEWPDDRRGTTPLMYAVSVGSLPLTEFLIARGADVNRSEQGDFETNTVLTGAFDAPDPLPVVSVLLRAGADPSLPRPDGWTPLMLASHDGRIDVTRALVEAGADVSASKDDGTNTAISLAEHWQHDDIVRFLRDHGATDPAEACAERLAALVSDISGWLAEHARPAYRSVVAAGGPADPAEVAELEAAVGARLPADFHAYLRLFGRSGGLDIFEYEGLSVKGILSTWRGLSDLHSQGTFNDRTPHGMLPGEDDMQAVWWHPGWVPFASDGGGNLYCIDLAPPRPGARGQVIEWEIQAGPYGPRASSFEEYLQDYRDKLLSGRYVYDEYSGTYDWE
ncbi:ankyrin repeat domain-containing protein [Streptomyces sp. NPDC051018]|uniref:ankyrin repeat domain-containing protein n=1 Tax=Streptomyces sp. NPDC051018 TaxID=3365639 RepID=UPI003793D0A6